MEESPRFHVYRALGGGAVADVILWRKWTRSAAFLVGSTALWFLFERAGYNLLSFTSNVLLLLIVILFSWAKSASLLNRIMDKILSTLIGQHNHIWFVNVIVSALLTLALVIFGLDMEIVYGSLWGVFPIWIGLVLRDLIKRFQAINYLNRPLPPLPNLEISEESSIKAADEMRVWINNVLSIAHDIAIDGNWKLFVKVAAGLWVISYIGSFFSFISLIYICILLSLSLPLLYEKYQNPIDDKLTVAHKFARTQSRKIDTMVRQKLPLPSKKEKKAQ